MGYGDRTLQAKLHAFNQTRSSSICWLPGKLFNAPADNEFCALSSIITPKITETQCRSARARILVESFVVYLGKQPAIACWDCWNSKGLVDGMWVVGGPAPAGICETLV